MATQLEKRLAELRSDFDAVRPNARTIAALRDNPGCAARRVLDAAGIDKSELANRLGRPGQEGQSRFAIQRGDRFEKDIKANAFAVAIDLLRRDGFELDEIRLLLLRDLYPIDGAGDQDEMLAKRAAETRSAITAMAQGKRGSYNLVDGGALEWDFGGAVARLETDGLAWRFKDQIHVVEVKSFPLVDGRADAGKVGATAWQGAVYIAAIQDLLEAEGLSIDLVSQELILMLPRNTALVPTMIKVDVTRHVRTLRRLLAGRESIDELMDRLPAGLSLEMDGLDEEHQGERVAEVLRKIGTSYAPSCLESCALARYCREQAREAHDPCHLGIEVRGSLAGVSSTTRAMRLADGGLPKEGEKDTARVLAGVHGALKREGLA